MQSETPLEIPGREARLAGGWAEAWRSKDWKHSPGARGHVGHGHSGGADRPQGALAATQGSEYVPQPTPPRPLGRVVRAVACAPHFPWRSEVGQTEPMKRSRGARVGEMRGVDKGRALITSQELPELG